MSRTLTVLGTAGALGSFKVSASANHCRSFGASRPGHLLASPHLYQKNSFLALVMFTTHDSRLAGSFQIEIFFRRAGSPSPVGLKPSEARLVQNNTAHTGENRENKCKAPAVGEKSCSALTSPRSRFTLAPHF